MSDPFLWCLLSPLVSGLWQAPCFMIVIALTTLFLLVQHFVGRINSALIVSCRRMCEWLRIISALENTLAFSEIRKTSKYPWLIYMLCLTLKTLAIPIYISICGNIFRFAYTFLQYILTIDLIILIETACTNSIIVYYYSTTNYVIFCR